MRLGIRGRLIAVSLGFIAIISGVSALTLQATMREWLTRRIERELSGRAVTARVAVETAVGIGEQLLAERLADAANARITIIAGDGRVLGDSQLHPNQIPALPNHGDRPEVIAAVQGGRGVSTRYSATLQVEMLYVAVRFERPAGHGVVRAALPLHEVNASNENLRALIGGAATIGAVFAILMSLLATRFFIRTLRQLIDEARDVAPQESTTSPTLTDELRGSVIELKTARDRLETILKGISDAVVAIDATGSITLANPAARLLLGLPPHPEGRRLGELIESQALLDLVAEGRAGATSRELRIGAADQQVLVRAAPLRATGGAVLAMLDVTAMRRIEKVRRDFVANVSHELRTPVSIIHANAETLLDGGMDDPKRAEDFLEAIVRNTDRISRLVADLLDLSRIESGRYPIEPKPISLVESIERAVANLPAVPRSQTITFAGVEARRVLADGNALEQVLVNLLDNASKYGATDGTIEVRAGGQNGLVRVEVEDDGPGIPTKDRPRIFERFYRVDRGRSVKTGGTGLGLAIVKHLVESMGGRVGVEPVEPNGSRFWFTLPIPEP